jgi:uncharacterized membrane protein YsdA (DUF1294 family)/cold shock CspA family protein
MRNQKAPRYQGRITSWKDDEGFGFITPNGGGPTVFVHINSFASRRKRPAGNEIVTYHLTANAAGQPRAEQVAFVGAVVRPAAPAVPFNGVPLALGFLALMGLLVVLHQVPARLFGAYLVMSVITFFAYCGDKAAAKANRRRTPEDTLHLMAVAGGWPGAFIAQQMVRHKTSKQAFRTVFWWTVAINCVALAALMTPAGRELFGSILGLR